VVHKMANRPAEQFSNELNLENGKKNILTYGFEILIGGIVKLFIFITISFSIYILKKFFTL